MRYPMLGLEAGSALKAQEAMAQAEAVEPTVQLFLQWGTVLEDLVEKMDTTI